MNRNEIKTLMDHHRGQCVDCGTEESAPSLDRIKQTEERLGVSLPDSYKWFLSNFGGVSIGGDEVSSIYPTFSDTVSSGDIVYLYENLLKQELVSEGQIPIFLTDFGETFFFDTSVCAEQAEYPVYVKLGEDDQFYASDFLDFIPKIIKVQCGDTDN